MTKRFFHYRCLPLALCLLVSVVFANAQSTDNGPLTNAAIVKLAKAGFKEKSLLTIIASRPARFDLSTDRLIELKRSGVSEKVILAMIARQEGYEFSDEGWDDEAFINPNASPNSSKTTTSGDGTSADIFGSSGGSRGTTKSNKGSGSSSGDIVTTGSATVRILRPPTEGGGTTAKLEKTPSLTNESVIELVEAGFSEGTIIRRVEQSPVDFDLAPAKVAELKKHRVSEKIVEAMKVAMGTGNSPTSNVTPRQ